MELTTIHSTVDYSKAKENPNNNKNTSKKESRST